MGPFENKVFKVIPKPLTVIMFKFWYDSKNIVFGELAVNSKLCTEFDEVFI